MSQQETSSHLAKAIGSATAGGGIGHSLSSIFMFRSLTSDSLRSLAEKCDWESYLAGETIIEYGEESTNVYFLTSGSVHVLNYTITGRAISFARLGEGSVFGELAAIDGKNRSATIVAETSCQVATLAARDFKSLLISEPNIALSLLEKMSGIIRMCDEQIFDVVSLGAQERVCLELLRLAKYKTESQKELVIDPCPSQSIIANGAHTTRETVARTISRLSTMKIVSRNGKAIFTDISQIAFVS
jgi:CRP-like cAMP-binding protein|tara:strand:+ start:66 stop:797 length:732 start_codon:yes stop_codon:yes gene_type:complete